MSHGSDKPVQWRGRRRAVTSNGIAALKGLYHAPFADVPDAGAGRPDLLEVFCRRSGTDGDGLAAALTVACAIRYAANGAAASVP